MGVLTDYFRAADTPSVVAAMAHDGGPLVGGPDPRFDGVKAKGIDSAVVLGQLIAIIESVPWDPDLVAQTFVWPATEPPGPSGPAADDPWATGPWVSELGTSVRDRLAAVPDTDLPGLVAQWVRVEELDGAPAENLLPLAEDLVALARRARDGGDRLYCWTCL